MTLARLYGQATFNFGAGRLNLNNTSNPLKIMLVGQAYTPNLDTHIMRGDVTSEITATGYTSGGVTLPQQSWTYDATNKWSVLKFGPVTFHVIPATVRYAVIYGNSQSTQYNDPLLGYFDFEENIDLTSKSLVLSCPPDGIFRLRKGA